MLLEINYNTYIIIRLGGDSDLTDRGSHYGLALSYFFNHNDIPGLRSLSYEMFYNSTMN